VLFQSRAVVRDWKTLLDLEEEINSVLYALSLSAMINENVVNP
jgi:hypothetical protein